MKLARFLALATVFLGGMTLPAGAQPAGAPQRVRIPTHVSKKMEPPPEPTKPMGGAAEDLEASLADAIQTSENAIQLLGNPKKKDAAKAALEGAHAKFRSLVKKSLELAKQEAAQATSVEKEADDAKRAVNEAGSIEQKRDAVKAETEARQKAVARRIEADNIEGSVNRQVQALKEYRAASKKGDAVGLRNASAVLSFEVRRMAISLNK